MGLFLDLLATDIFNSRIGTDFTDFLYMIYLAGRPGFALTLGFASCIRDSTDLAQNDVIPLRDASGNNSANVGTHG